MTVIACASGMRRLLPVDDGQRISVGMLCNSPGRPAGLFRVL
jgi:hypothetical protein